MFDSTICPLCRFTGCEEFLRRESVPVQQNFLTISRQKALRAKRGDLRMYFCPACGFVFNQAFEPDLMIYDSDYNNTQESSDCFKEHLINLKNRLVHEGGLRQATIAEIGCGKGYFLKMLVLDDALGNRGFGFDPSYEGEELLGNGRLRFEKKYFDSKCRGFSADALICRHVIEHVPDPVKFIGEISEALRDAPHCRLFFETPCVEWIIASLTIWDFFYEHCSLFSTGTLNRLFIQSGYKVKSIEHVFGGQYLWLEAVKADRQSEPTVLPADFAEKVKKFAGYERKLISDWKSLVQKLKQQGPLAIWGAGAKGVTFLNLFDPRCQLIDMVIDLNADKHNRYIPGTGHEVVDCRRLAESGVKNVIVMNPNYLEEIRALLAESDIRVNLIIEPGELK